MEKSSVLQVQKKCVTINDEDMRHIEGGISIAVSGELLNKNECLKLGAVYGPQIGLSSDRVAKEIYAHAVLYYTSATSLISMSATLGPGFGPGTDIAILASLKYIKAHANPIDLGGDSAFRVAVFNAIWNLY